MATAPNQIVQAIKYRLEEYGLEDDLDARRMAIGLAADVKRIVEKKEAGEPAGS